MQDPATVGTPNRNCAFADLKNFVLNIVEVARWSETGRRTVIENAKVVVRVKAESPDASHFAPGGNGKFAQTLSPAYDGGFRCVRHAADSNLRELLWERLICSGLLPIRFLRIHHLKGSFGFERAAANSTQTAEELAGAAQAG
jgi:hypothetical protein